MSPKLREENGYYVWNKGEVFDLSTHFSTKEFNCQCKNSDCVEQKVFKGLVDKLDNIREEINQPLDITSAFRCHKHQETIRVSGVSTVVAKKSTHELGDAVDIVPRDRKDVRGGFLKICEKEFEAIGLSDKFLHVDLRSGRKRRWEY